MGRKIIFKFFFSVETTNRSSIFLSSLLRVSLRRFQFTIFDISIDNRHRFALFFIELFVNCNVSIIKLCFCIIFMLKFNFFLHL